MSYCRYPVYAYRDLGGGYVCCGARILSLPKFVEHLRMHAAAGLDVTKALARAESELEAPPYDACPECGGKNCRGADCAYENAVVHYREGRSAQATACGLLPHSRTYGVGARWRESDSTRARDYRGTLEASTNPKEVSGCSYCEEVAAKASRGL